MRQLRSFSIATAILLLAACGETRTERGTSGRLPAEWETAAVDPRTGGRYLPERHAELSRFQDAVAAAGRRVLYPHYADPRTVVVAIKASLVESRIRRRMKLLLTNEGVDSELAVLAITDAPVQQIEDLLGLVELPAWKRVSLVPVLQHAPAPVTFPFVRDYAPLVLAKPVGGVFQITGLGVFRGSNLNKVVDRDLDVKIYRNVDALRERSKLTRRLVELYKENLPEILTHLLETALDGGNIVADGRGSCFLTRIVIDKNGGDVDAIERDLADNAGCLRTIFLEAPKRLDFVQHVDTLLYFADAQNVILSMPTLYESDHERELRNTRTLLELGYKVHLLPRLTASITYTNILTTRKNVYVPQYSGYNVETEEMLRRRQQIESLDRVRDRDRLVRLLRLPTETRTVRNDAELEADNRRALEIVGTLLPDKNVVAVNSDETLGSLGSWHCLSHELP